MLCPTNLRRRMKILSALLATFALLFTAGTAATDPLSTEQALQKRVIRAFQDWSAPTPITVIEYASLTCSHCASFHRNTMPELKRVWIDTGRVTLVYRDFPLDKIAALRSKNRAHCCDR